MTRFDAGLASAAFRVGVRRILLVRRRDVVVEVSPDLIARSIEALAGLTTSEVETATNLDGIRASLVAGQQVFVRGDGAMNLAARHGALVVNLGGARGRVAAIPRSALWDAARSSNARRLVERIVASDDVGAHLRLRWLADSVAIDWEGAASLAHAISAVVDAIEMGRLVVIDLPEIRPSLDAPGVVELRDVNLDGPGGRLQPDDPGPDRPGPLTWVSFDVVDDRGEPADGRFRIAIDASVAGDPLERRPHRFDELREGANVRLLVEQLRWAEASDRPPVAPRADGPRSGPVAHDVFSLEIVDDQGVPLRGIASIAWDGGGTRSQEIAHRMQQRLSTATPISLELAGLRPEVPT